MVTRLLSLKNISKIPEKIEYNKYTTPIIKESIVEEIIEEDKIIEKTIEEVIEEEIIEDEPEVEE
jgi:hypothetical protein